MKPVQICFKSPICSFDAAWITPVIDPYLKFEKWDHTRTYPRGTLFYTNFLDFNDPETINFCQHLTELGFKVIIDNLWEVNPGPISNTFRVCCDSWFWYNESLWYKHLGLDKYQPNSIPEYLALMPMRLKKPHRDDFLRVVNHLLDRMMWSYMDIGRQLPDDADPEDDTFQRYMNPKWYDSTYLSMVVETNVLPGSDYTPIFITEKTFKPMAFQHPFVVYGNRHTLQTLRNWDFETWGNLWDESYDDLMDVDARRDTVVELLKNIQIVQHDKITQEKLQHNYNRFFDNTLVRSRIIKEIVEPILEYAETI